MKSRNQGMKRNLLKTHTLSYSFPGTALSANEIKRIGLLKNEWHMFVRRCSSISQAEWSVR